MSPNFPKYLASARREPAIQPWNIRALRQKKGQIARIIRVVLAGVRRKLSTLVPALPPAGPAGSPDCLTAQRFLPFFRYLPFALTLVCN
jgi:hypothetical protein